MALSQLTLAELDSLYNMCDRRRHILFRQKSVNQNDKRVNDEYMMYFGFINKLDEELYKRTKKFIEDDKNETTKEVETHVCDTDVADCAGRQKCR